MLNTRPKWTAVVKDLMEGDVVLVLEKDQYREDDGRQDALWKRIQVPMDTPELLKFTVEIKLS